MTDMQRIGQGMVPSTTTDWEAQERLRTQTEEAIARAREAAERTAAAFRKASS